VNAKTILGWLALAFVVWWVMANHTEAAHAVSNIGQFLTMTAHDISNFFVSI
jgi:hypothetical protein